MRAAADLELVAIEGAVLLMGSDLFYPEEAPVTSRSVAPFRIGRSPVTNAQFARFADCTGYVTTAERPLDPAHFPRARGLDVTPGSVVFTPTDGPVNLRDWRQWWRWTPGAQWRSPAGPGSDIYDKDDHPVVQVSFEDATEYARWAGVRLPSEVEWELAARGGLVGATYVWGEQPQDEGPLKANTWQGAFPYANLGARGWKGTSPIGAFGSNGFGLVDMAGNVWEWTITRWTDRQQMSSCSCSPGADTGPAARAYTVKGGSHLCAPEYCLRYRPAARSRQTADSATTHLGFRVAASG